MKKTKLTPFLNNKVSRLAAEAVFLSIILIIGFIERTIPFDFTVPGVKLGLSNIVVLTMLYLFTPLEVLVVVILKCLLTSFFSGSMVSFIYSLSGSLLSYALMLASIKFLKNTVSPVGVSVIGAVFHNVGQILAVCVVLKNPAIIMYLPLLLIPGVITGVFVGITAKRILKFLKAD